jgi:hypothetical protein
MLKEWIRGISYKYPTAAFAAVGAPEKPFHIPDLGTPCCETKVRALNTTPCWRKPAWGPGKGYKGPGAPKGPRREGVDRST